MVGLTMASLLSSSKIYTSLGIAVLYHVLRAQTRGERFTILKRCLHKWQCPCVSLCCWMVLKAQKVEDPNSIFYFYQDPLFWLCRILSFLCKIWDTSIRNILLKTLKRKVYSKVYKKVDLKLKSVLRVWIHTRPLMRIRIVINSNI
jgi:hypothetical protein